MAKCEDFWRKWVGIFTTSDFLKTTSEVILTTSDLVLTTFDVVFAHLWAKKGGNRVASPSVVQRYNKICQNANRAF